MVGAAERQARGGRSGELRSEGGRGAGGEADALEYAVVVCDGAGAVEGGGRDECNATASVVRSSCRRWRHHTFPRCSRRAKGESIPTAQLQCGRKM